MDKSWMSKDRNSSEYKFGVEKFLIFAEENASNPKEIPCPCAHCFNFKKFSIKIIRGHLYENGFRFGYVNWIWHGEKCSRSTGSVGTQGRQSKAMLTTKHVIPYVGQKKNLMMPPKKYAFMGKEVWKRFFAKRAAEKWLRARVSRRRYPPQLSRKGYIDLQDDILLEKKRKGQFQSSGSEDVLSKAMETPENSCRIGSLVTPKLFFNFKKEKRTRITNAELLASDRWWAEELVRTKQYLMSEIADLKAMLDLKSEVAELKAMLNLRSDIADLKAMIIASNLPSPIPSDEASCQLLQKGNKFKPTIVKELMVDGECVADNISLQLVD